ncbi:MAG TPA: 3-isopropylmalate dehydratase small subunit [Leptospiraceae bacterium]|nr:3-isopropylmalate dehydratase small subunit [Leptospiraceae bacterium]
MKSWKKHTGKAVPLCRDDIDTDQILPAVFMRKISRTGFGEHLFHNWRYLDSAGETLNPAFILNQPRYSEATVLIAGRNFGSGSSREHAPWALYQYGFRVIISESFADIFYNNCFKNGIALIRLSEKDILEILEFEKRAGAGLTVTADLEKSFLECAGKKYPFEISDALKERILFGMDDIDRTLKNEKLIDSYLAGRKQTLSLR